MLEILNLSPLGALHTVVSLVALVAAAVALIGRKEILPKTGVGQVYVWATVIVCMTGFGIYRHGGFGKPHALGIMTLLVFAFAMIEAQKRYFGARSARVVALSYSLTVFFHTVPTVTETVTRFPLGAPLTTNRESPGILVAVGVLFVIFLIGAALQYRWLSHRES